ncbi:tetratricopeptide repeat protein [Flocculibacter collagenilyticus]|uniref:tetratricopeptide repeat protein n=1 Tax=Flocculibacter collagenilyticus TaxID=2744479 RepID=UPI0018F6E1CD|nr:tetratricopeptide repeat protein [Flocculibacter collagenilyticus]
MKQIFKASALALALATTVNMSVVSYAQAADQQKIEERKKRKSQVLSQSVGRKVAKAFELYSADQIDEAIALLLEVDASKPFDAAYISRFLGNMYAGQEGKGKLAIKHLKKAVAPDLLNFTEHAQSVRLLADLHSQEKQYKEAIKAYYDWMNFTGKEDEKVYIRIANAHYELKELSKVIGPADKAIKLQTKPNETPYVLKMASFYERKKYNEAVKVVEMLVKLFPEDKRWWPQLGQFYLLIEDYQKALSTMELAYKQGHLDKESHIKVLSQLYATNSIPYKAAVLQEKFMNNGDSALIKRTKQSVSTLANSWHAAKETRKAAHYYGEAAKFDNDAELYRKQGSLLNESERYAEAIPVFEKALKHGSKKRGRIYLSMAEAYFYQEKYKEAHEAIKNAMKDPSTKRTARSWASYIKDTAKRKGQSI